MADIGAEALLALLQQHYEYPAFRPLQLDAIQAVITGRDVLLTLPTGGGKSLTFQLPALATNKISVVVTPLLALAKDQVDACNDVFSIEAASWSSETPEERKALIARELLAEEEDCSLRLLYTTPESLAMPRLADLLAEAHGAGRLACLAVDEAHCCSQWGHDFRPAYLQLGEFRQCLPKLPCIAVTATATPAVQESIAELLGMRRPRTLQASFNRPNIALEVRYKELLEAAPGGDGSGDCGSGGGGVLADVTAFIQSRLGQRGLVYCRLRSTCDAVAAALRNADIEAAAYHAGLDPQRRARVQRDWRDGGIDVIVATIAFGMGIDVADVRYVLHYDAPASLEGFYQELGRAGRDGKPALSVLYLADEELRKNQRMERGERRGATAAVAEYAQHAACRRRALLAHFGERRGRCDVAEGELACDVCADAAGVRARLAALQKKLPATAAPEQHDAADPFDRGDEEGGGTTNGSKTAPLQVPNAAAAHRPLVKPVLPARRPLPPPAAAAQEAAAEEERDESGADHAPEEATLPPGGALHPAHAAAVAGMKRSRAGFQPPRRAVVNEK